jgi:small subunit ribosomal protein S25e
MGGNKKKPVPASDKSATAQQSGEIKTSKKDETKKNARPAQKLSVIIDETLGKKALQGMRAITAQALARSIGVKVSVANNFIKMLESKEALKQSGGYSGHRIYKMVEVNTPRI